YAPDCDGGPAELSSSVTSESTRTIAGLSPLSPICSCSDNSVASAASESSSAVFSSCPAFTAASRTSSSLTSPTSRRTCAIFKRLSASSAVRRESRPGRAQGGQGIGSAEGDPRAARQRRGDCIRARHRLLCSEYHGQQRHCERPGESHGRKLATEPYGKLTR